MRSVMISILNLLLLFPTVRVFGINDFIFGPNYDESIACTRVLIRKFDSKANYRIEDIHTVAKCPEDYNSSSIIKQKCETNPPDEAVLEDIFLFTLGLEMTTKTVLYFNVYCAICNGLKEFCQFSPHFYYQLDESVSTKLLGLENGKKNYNISEHPALLSKLKKKAQSVGLISYNELGVEFKFKPYRVLIVPKRSKKIFSNPMQPFRPPLLPYCEDSPRQNFRCSDNSTKIDSCFYHDENYANIFDSRDTLEKLRANLSRPLNATYCPEQRLDSGGESSNCKYEDRDGYVCWWNKFLLKGVDYVEGDNGEIFFVDKYTMINMSRDEYSSQTGIRDVIYLCGVNQKKDYENEYCIEIMNSIQAMLRRVSILCVVIYLLIHSRRKVLAVFIEKLTYSYYATLLMMYLREELSDMLHNRSCFLDYSAYRYLLQSYTFWILVSSWYIWKIIGSPDRVEKSCRRNVSKNTITYVSMCLICWLLPALFALLFYLLEPTSSCPVIPGYSNMKLCKSPDELDPYFGFIFVTMLIISGLVSIQFLTSCYRYQLGKKRRVEDKGHNDWRNTMVFFFKIFYSMVLYMMLLVAAAVDPDGATYGVLWNLWSFHGTLIFFLYSFKKMVLRNLFVERGSPEGAPRVEETSDRRSEKGREDELVGEAI